MFYLLIQKKRHKSNAIVILFCFSIKNTAKFVSTIKKKQYENFYFFRIKVFCSIFSVHAHAFLSKGAQIFNCRFAI